MTEIRFHRVLTVLLTAALLATLTVALTGGQRADAVDGPVEVVYVATGRNFPDALAGATLAATVGAPLLTVEPDLPIPDATITALQSLDPNRIVILGGPVAVSDAVRGALVPHARSGSVTRIEGTDRHDTAAAIADALPDKVHDADLLDGLDSSAFLRSDTPMGAIYGTRARNLGFQPVPATFAAIRTLTFTAPADGFLQVNTSVYLDNNSGGRATAVVYVLYDWDGDASATSRAAAAVAVDEVGLPVTDDDTSTLTTALPVTAGTHTIHLAISGDPDTAYDAPSISAVFTPSGEASPVGIETT